MSGLFKLLGVLLAMYTLYSALRGEVYAKQRAWGLTFRRTEEPRWFWTVIVIYAGLSVALLTVF
jgi:hypothetical protein